MTFDFDFDSLTHCSLLHTYMTSCGRAFCILAAIREPENQRIIRRHPMSDVRHATCHMPLSLSSETDERCLPTRLHANGEYAYCQQTHIWHTHTHTHTYSQFVHRRCLPQISAQDMPWLCVLPAVVAPPLSIVPPLPVPACVLASAA